MKRVYVAGLGAVSPAGWGVAALRSALERNERLPASAVARPGWDRPLWVREVPLPSPRPAFLSHPRLRRASPITQYAAGAVTEALKMNGAAREGQKPLGLVMCMHAGCVQYTQRFFGEVLQDPATAGPLLFPETVFNAPASHLAALLEKPPLTYTLLGGPAIFLQGLGVGAEWILEERVDGCVIVGAEETNWLLADVIRQFDRNAQPAAGAGAVMITASREHSLGVELTGITEPQLYTRSQNRRQASKRVRESLPTGTRDEVLCDGLQGNPRADAAESGAWGDWPGGRISPKVVLGEGLMAASAWQCVAAIDALLAGRFGAANVSVVDANQQAIGARFCRT